MKKPLSFSQLPRILPGMTIWGARGRKHTYVISQDQADKNRFSISIRHRGTGRQLLDEFSLYTTFEDAVALCEAIEKGRRQ